MGCGENEKCVFIKNEEKVEEKSNPVNPNKPVGEVDPNAKPVGEVDPNAKPVGEVDPNAKPDGEVDPNAKPDGEVYPNAKPDGEVDPDKANVRRMLTKTTETAKDCNEKAKKKCTETTVEDNCNG